MEMLNREELEQTIKEPKTIEEIWLVTVLPDLIKKGHCYVDSRNENCNELKKFASYNGYTTQGVGFYEYANEHENVIDDLNKSNMIRRDGIKISIWN